jgi:hypothetical protein
MKIACINFNVAYYSIFGTVIMNITVILHPLCARTDLFLYTLPVNWYSHVMAELDN